MSIRSEIVARVDPLVDGRVSADDKPRGGLEFPYILVRDHLTEGPALKGDRRAMAWVRTVQVSLFQTTEDEDADLLDQVLDVLDGATITRAMHLSVQGSTRVPDPNPAVVHHAITCSLARPRQVR